MMNTRPDEMARDIAFSDLRVREADVDLSDSEDGC